MPRETAFDRGRRMILEGRLVIDRVNDREVRAHIRGDSGEVHEVGYTRGGFHCSCPCRGRCGHLVALMLVTLRPGGRSGQNEGGNP